MRTYFQLWFYSTKTKRRKLSLSQSAPLKIHDDNQHIYVNVECLTYLKCNICAQQIPFGEMTFKCQECKNVFHSECRPNVHKF